MEAMRKEFDIIREENIRISSAVNARDNHFKKTFREIKQETTQLKNMITDLDKQNLQLKSKLAQIQQSTLYNAVKIVNFPIAKKKDPLEVFKKICNLVEFDFNFEYIKNSYCLNPRNTKFRPIIVIKCLQINLCF